MARIPYNASQLDDMRTLLTKLNYIRQLLEEYPSQQWFYDDTESITGNIGETYTINISDLELLGRNPVISDFVITYDSNGDAWVGQITTLGETQVTITILGKLGYKGDTGATGPTGPTGPSGTNGVSVTNVQVDGSNHLIVTLSNGNTIDAGQIATGGSVDLTPFLKSNKLTSASTPIEVTAILDQDGFTSVELSVRAGYTIPTTNDLNNKITNPMSNVGDIIVGSTSGTPSRVAIGTNGQVLTSDGTTASWQTPSATGVTSIGGSTGAISLGSGLTISSNTLSASASGMTNPMTNVGDLIVGSTSGTPSRIAIGTNGQVLTSDGTTASWQTPSGSGSSLTGHNITINYNISSNKGAAYIIYFTTTGIEYEQLDFSGAGGTTQTYTKSNVLFVHITRVATYTKTRIFDSLFTGTDAVNHFIGYLYTDNAILTITSQ